jgi:outer membrane protein
MKNYRSIPLFLAFLAAAACPAAAADPAPSSGKIGIVSVDRVFKEYKATQLKEAELQKLTESKQAEREKKVAEIRSLRDELALLNEDNREKQKLAIEQKLQGLAAFDQQTRVSLGGQRDEAISALLKEIEEVVTTLAKEKGYDLILSDRAALYRADAYDLTGDVITVLNGRYGKSK